MNFKPVLPVFHYSKDEAKIIASVLMDHPWTEDAFISLFAGETPSDHFLIEAETLAEDLSKEIITNTQDAHDGIPEA